MAARLNPRQDERCRAAIQTTQLCKRLNLFALGMEDPQSMRPVEMTDTQVRAALGLLRKTLPDLAVTELRGDPERPLAVEFSWAPAASVAVSHETTPAPPVIDATPEPASTDTEFVWGKSDDAA